MALSDCNSPCSDCCALRACGTFRRGAQTKARSHQGAWLTKARKQRKVSAPPEASSGATTKTDASVDLTRLLDLVASLHRQTIGVVGDFVLDEFVSGEISRVSREAPVLILRHRHTEAYPGGAANAVSNLAALGARVLAVGVVGDDPGGRKILEQFEQQRVNTAGILRVRNWSTT